MTSVHLTAEKAWELADQLRWLVRNHYQGTDQNLTKDGD